MRVKYIVSKHLRFWLCYRDKKWKFQHIASTMLDLVECECPWLIYHRGDHGAGLFQLYVCLEVYFHHHQPAEVPLCSVGRRLRSESPSRRGVMRNECMAGCARAGFESCQACGWCVRYVIDAGSGSHGQRRFKVLVLWMNWTMR